ncbi:MAG: hypothetical protein O3A00_03745, partial [Planctomycetota bacterium]|nr:hypothetical protein [Planctomycetota bacterium]
GGGGGEDGGNASGIAVPGGDGGGPNGGTGGASGGAAGTNATGDGGGGGGGDFDVSGPSAGNGGIGGFGGGGGGGGFGATAGAGGFGGGGGSVRDSAGAVGGFGAGGGNSNAGGAGGGFGGGVFNRAGTVTIINSTFSGNSASGGDSPNVLGIGAGAGSGFGGGLFNLDGTVTVFDSTFASNDALAGASSGTGSVSGEAEGGAIYNLQSAGTATLTLHNSILADTPSATSDAFNDGGTIGGSTSNIVEANSGGANAVPATAIIANNGDPNLDVLADYGGPTLTHDLLPGSRAVNAGLNANVSPGALTDQRGETRVFNTIVDIGSVEITRIPVEFSVATASDVESTGGNIPVLLINGIVPTAQTIDVNVTGGTATGADFTNTVMVNIPAATYDGTVGTAVPINLAIISDGIVEADETIELTLANPSANVTISDANSDLTAQGTHTYTITNDNTATLTVQNLTALETNAGTTTFTFNVVLSNAVQGGFTVPIDTADGTATVANSDYAANTGSTLTFAGTTNEVQTFAVTVNGDTIVEADETFAVLLGALSAIDATAADDITTSNGTGTITNDDTATLTVANLSTVETDAGTTSLTFNVVLSNDVQGGFQVAVATLDGTAVSAAADYVANSDTLTFSGSSGESVPFTVTLNGDTVVEADETFSVTLGALTAIDATAADDITSTGGTGTITNDDTATLTIANLSEFETDAGPTTFTFTATLSNAVQGGFQVMPNTADDTATVASGDFVSVPSGPLTFAGSAGETQTFQVTVNGDEIVESNETFLVGFNALTAIDPTAADDITLTGATGTIQNDDSATLTVSDMTAFETDAGTTTFSFNVTLSHAVQDGIDVDVNTSDATATAGLDYVAHVATLLSFAGTVGEVQSIDVVVNGDTVVEADETFLVDLVIPPRFCQRRYGHRRNGHDYQRRHGHADCARREHDRNQLRNDRANVQRRTLQRCPGRFPSRCGHR